MPTGIWTLPYPSTGLGIRGKTDRAPGRCSIRLCPRICVSFHGVHNCLAERIQGHHISGAITEQCMPRFASQPCKNTLMHSSATQALSHHAIRLPCAMLQLCTEGSSVAYSVGMLLCLRKAAGLLYTKSLLARCNRAPYCMMHRLACMLFVLLQVVLAVRAAFVLLLIGFARSILGVRSQPESFTAVLGCYAKSQHPCNTPFKACHKKLTLSLCCSLCSQLALLCWDYLLLAEYLA